MTWVEAGGSHLAVTTPNTRHKPSSKHSTHGQALSCFSWEPLPHGSMNLITQMSIHVALFWGFLCWFGGREYRGHLKFLLIYHFLFYLFSCVMWGRNRSFVPQFPIVRILLIVPFVSFSKFLCPFYLL